MKLLKELSMLAESTSTDGQVVITLKKELRDLTRKRAAAENAQREKDFNLHLHGAMSRDEFDKRNKKSDPNLVDGYFVSQGDDLIVGPYLSKESASKAKSRLNGKDYGVTYFRGHKNQVKLKEGRQMKGEEPGWYVEKNDKIIAGPFDNQTQANAKCNKLGGIENGYDVTYVSDYAAKRV